MFINHGIRFIASGHFSLNPAVFSVSVSWTEYVIRWKICADIKVGSDGFLAHYFV